MTQSRASEHLMWNGISFSEHSERWKKGGMKLNGNFEERKMRNVKSFPIHAKAIVLVALLLIVCHHFEFSSVDSSREYCAWNLIIFCIELNSKMKIVFTRIEIFLKIRLLNWFPSIHASDSDENFKLKKVLFRQCETIFKTETISVIKSSCLGHRRRGHRWTFCEIDERLRGRRQWTSSSSWTRKKAKSDWNT